VPVGGASGWADVIDVGCRCGMGSGFGVDGVGGQDIGSI